MPLIDRLADRTIDKARLLQYFAAVVGIDWGVHELVDDREELVESGAGLRPLRELTVRDRLSGEEHRIRYPDRLRDLPSDIEPLMIAEYKRLIMNRPLTLMAEPLFTWFFAEEFCAHCRWLGNEHDAAHRECRFAGYPVNFEAESA